MKASDCTTLKECIDGRAKAITEARRIHGEETKDRDEKRSITQELKAQRREQFDRAMQDAEEFRLRQEELEADEKRSKTLAEGEQWLKQSAGRKTDPELPGDEYRGKDEAVDFEIRSLPDIVAHPHLIHEPPPYEKISIRAEDKDPDRMKIFRRSRVETRALYNKFLRFGDRAMEPAEYRDLQNDLDVQGGFLQSPIQMIQFLLKFIDNIVIVRKLATIYTVPTAVSLGVPSLDSDLDDAAWTAEIATAPADATTGSGIQFGRRELHPHPLAKMIKVSDKLLRTAILSPEAIVRDRMGYKFGVAMEKGYMTGSGNSQPLGLFTASTMGVSTSQDVNTYNTTTSIAADNLYATKYNVKPQYQAEAEWLFHRTVLQQIMTLKDGIGQYLWHQGLQPGQPDILLGRPVNQSEYAPNTMTTGQYVGMFAAFRFYWIADALSLQVQRLNELFAQTNQVGFIGRAESDGMPVLQEAFSRMKLA